MRTEQDASSSGDILRIARHQDRDAFARLFAIYAPRVKAYLIRQGVSPELAEDLAQETLVRVWRRAATFNPVQATASAWIFAISRNLWIDHLRRERHPSVLDGRALDAPAEPETPDQVLEAGERDRRLQKAMRELPAEQLTVLHMAFFGGHTHAQIAEQLELPLGTVKSRLRLALARVRDSLGDP